jgi:hypothetical protein
VEEGEDLEDIACIIVKSHFSRRTLEEPFDYLKEKHEILSISVFHFIFFFSNHFIFRDLTKKIDNSEDI